MYIYAYDFPHHAKTRNYLKRISIMQYNSTEAGEREHSY